MSHIDTLVHDAQSYIGQQEIQPNQGFQDPAFSAKMFAVGFYKGASWCAFFVMMVLFETYADEPDVLAYLKKYCSPATATMWQNFRASPQIITGQTPKQGGIAIWEEGNGTNGHTGIVVDVNADGIHFTTVEGNSNTDGSRDGYEVAQNTHIIGQPYTQFNLNLLGFGYMPN
jgi:CHAP domain